MDDRDKNKKVAEMVKGEKTVKVSEENHKRLFSLAGKMQEAKGRKQTPNDAISYLFENQHKEKGNK